MLWYHSLYEIYMRSLLYYARVRAWNVLNCQELALTTITVRVLVSIITVITTDSRPHSVLILHLQKPPSPGLCAPFHWNLDSGLEVASQHKALLPFLTRQLCEILSLHFKHFQCLIAPEDDKRTTSEIHCCHSYYFTTICVRMSKPANIKHTMWQQFFCGTCNSRTRTQWQKVILDI